MSKEAIKYFPIPDPRKARMRHWKVSKTVYVMECKQDQGERAKLLVDALMELSLKAFVESVKVKSDDTKFSSDLDLKYFP